MATDVSELLTRLHAKFPEHGPSEELMQYFRQPNPGEDTATLVAGPKPHETLADRLRAKGPLSEEQAALLEEVASEQNGESDRKFNLLVEYLESLAAAR